MRRFLRNNGLSIVLFLLFASCIVGQAYAGWRVMNDDLRQHGQAALGFAAYLGSGEFLSATFENWESEFLQMALYVVLTMFLFQKGSPQSKKLDEPNPEDADPKSAVGQGVPNAVRRGGLMLTLYSHSLSLALFLLFAASFWLHLASSTAKANEEAALHGAPLLGVADVLAEPEFWFESMQNWQSEFLSLAVLLILGIYLRQRGSPESKPVAAPHDLTGH